MTCEKSINLVRGWKATLDDEVLECMSEVCSMSYEDLKLARHRTNSNPNVKALAEYIEEQVLLGADYARFNFLAFNAMIENEEQRTTLQLELDRQFVANLRNLLPDPFFLLEVKLEGGPGPESNLVKKRFPLGDMPDFVVSSDVERDVPWDMDEVHREEFTLENKSNDIAMLTCTISLDVGWHEPLDKMQLCAQTFMQRLFQDETDKDLTLVAGNGVGVKCHRIIFAAHSPTFAAMVSSKTGMKEAQTGRIELSENSEEGIRLLLQYLYGMELILNDASSDVLVELFQTAHKYDLSQMVTSLGDLFMKKDEKWFTPGGLLELYFFIRNMDEDEAMIMLAEHALRLLASVKDLGSCEEFKKLNQAESTDLLSKLLTALQKCVPKPWPRPGVAGVKRKRDD